MKVTLQRLYHTSGNPAGDYSGSFLQVDNGEKFRSFVIEDTYRKDKIKGETRIPSGYYELKIHKELTPLTKKHRLDYAKTDWFKDHPNWFHIEVTGIPNYSGVYVHSGVDDSHTAGCLLPCYALDSIVTDRPGSKSLIAVSAFYALIYPRLEAGERIYIEVKDEQL